MEMNESLIDEIIINKVENLFVKKELNEKNSAVIAAIITAASEMAKCSDIIDSETMVTQLLDLYKKNENEEVKSLIGMAPEYVNNNIGYSVDFRDFSSAKVNYDIEKAKYDEVYTEIGARAKTEEVERKLA